MHNLIAFEEKIDLLVVSAGSTDGTNEFVMENYPDFFLLQGKESWWWTECMNAGFNFAVNNRYDFVLVLNDDIDLYGNYLDTLFSDYYSLHETCILGSVSVDIEPPHRILSSGSSSFSRLLLKPQSYHYVDEVRNENLRGVHPTFNLSGRGTLIPVPILSQIGFYDKELVQYGSDDEFVLRARNAGFNVYISWNAVIYSHSKLTSYAAAHQKPSLKKFLKSFVDKYSVNSIRKQLYLYQKYGYSAFLPFYLVYFVLGAFYAQFIKYRGFHK
ncbi:MAG: hypothetical protein L6Q66_11530 [Bacteroidia bacterium]|nr:hypothetical protein [Bacteroidia bacterium]